MTSPYLKLIHFVGLAHRQFMELLQTELSKRLQEEGITPVQAMLVFNLGDAEMSVGDLVDRDCYVGSNVSNNVQRLIEGGWLEKRRDQHDKRLSLIRATAKGTELQQRLNHAFEAHVAEMAKVKAADGDKISNIARDLQDLGDFWQEMTKAPCHRNWRPQSAA